VNRMRIKHFSMLLNSELKALPKVFRTQHSAFALGGGRGLRTALTLG